MFKISFEEELPYSSGGTLLSATYQGKEYYCAIERGFKCRIYSKNKLSDKSVRERYNDIFFGTVVPFEELTDIYQTYLFAEYCGNSYQVLHYNNIYPRIVLSTRGGDFWKSDRLLGFSFDGFFEGDVLEIEKSKTELYGAKHSIYDTMKAKYDAYRKDPYDK